MSFDRQGPPGKGPLPLLVWSSSNWTALSVGSEAEYSCLAAAKPAHATLY